MKNKYEIKGIDFGLAKLLISDYHRTTKAPVQHRESFMLVEHTNYDYEPLTVLDDSWTTWLEKNYNCELRPEYNFDIYADYEQVFSKGKILGVCSIGNPVAPKLMNKKIYEINRICFLEHFKPITNFERKLPSKFIREATKMFCENYKVKQFVTYLHNYENGKYLEYANFKFDGLVEYSKNHKGWNNRPNRIKSDLNVKKRFIKLLDNATSSSSSDKSNNKANSETR